MTAATMAPERARVGLTEDSAIFIMTIVCVVAAFGGFAAEYWLPHASGTLKVPAIMHIHGYLASAWTILLAIQAWLIVSGARLRHRAVGIAGISLVTAVVITGLLISINSIRKQTALGFGDGALTFSVVPVLGMVFFAGMVAAAMVFARDRGVHKRLMLVATIGILEAPLARVFKIFMTPPEILNLPLTEQPGPPLFAAVPPGILCDVLVLVAIGLDWKARGKPHPVYYVALAVLIGMQVLRMPIGPSDPWHSFASWLAALPG